MLELNRLIVEHKNCLKRNCNRLSLIQKIAKILCAQLVCICIILIIFDYIIVFLPGKAGVEKDYKNCYD